MGERADQNLWCYLQSAWRWFSGNRSENLPIIALNVPIPRSKQLRKSVVESQDERNDCRGAAVPSPDKLHNSPENAHLAEHYTVVHFLDSGNCHANREFLVLKRSSN